MARSTGLRLPGRKGGPAASSDRKSTRLNSSHTVIYTLSLHDALPIFYDLERLFARLNRLYFDGAIDRPSLTWSQRRARSILRSEEHTSELQSHSDLHSFPTRRSSDLLRSGAIVRPPEPALF